MRSHALMAVFAHPDDEGSVSGVLARANAEGHPVTLVCATRGEAGEIADPSLATPQTLGEVREQELREACHELGVSQLIILGYGDGQLAALDEAEGIGRIVTLVRRLRPTVLVTFDPYGGYGHPDHITVNKWTTQAFVLSGDRNAYPEQIDDGLQPYSPAKLYYRAFPQSVINVLKQRVPRLSITLDGVERPIEGIPDHEITTEIDVSQYIEQKWRAFNAHRTQEKSRGPFSLLSADEYRRMMTREYLMLAQSRLPVRQGRERSVFEGLD